MTILVLVRSASDGMNKEDNVFGLNQVIGCFMTGALDNLDKIKKSNTSNSSWNGTAISLVQHPDSSTTTETWYDKLTFDISKDDATYHLNPLPEYYTTIDRTENISL